LRTLPNSQFQLCDATLTPMPHTRASADRVFRNFRRAWTNCSDVVPSFLENKFYAFVEIMDSHLRGNDESLIRYFTHDISVGVVLGMKF